MQIRKCGADVSKMKTIEGLNTSLSMRIYLTYMHICVFKSPRSNINKIDCDRNFT